MIFAIFNLDLEGNYLLSVEEKDIATEKMSCSNSRLTPPACNWK